MDGNRRWAKEKFFPAVAGHKAWADNVVHIVKYAREKWVKYMTLWALSKDNLLKRDASEIETIIRLINNVEHYLEAMIQEWLKFETIGDIAQLPQESQDILKKVKERTKDNRGIVLILALVYSWQDEIVRGIHKFIAQGGDIWTLDTHSFRNYLDTASFPVVDLIVRTWGDMRHSGFLLYDSEYTQYYFSEKKWPDFCIGDLQNAFDDFAKAKRNFGK